MARRFWIALFVLLAAPAWAQSPLEVRHVSVTGEATAKLVPDQAMLSVTVQTEDAKLTTAKEKNDQRLKKALAVAKEFGLTDKQIRLSQSNISPQYDYKNGSSRPVFRSYVVSHTLVLTLPKPEKAALLMDALTQQGVDQMGGLSFGLADEKKARDELLEKALADAKAKAGRMAAALGATLGEPLTISEQGGGVHMPVPRPMMARMEMAVGSAKMMDASPELPSGEIEVSSSVSVVFALK
jgi:uncharacterized protein YggE